MVELYILFSLTTAIVGVVQIFIPVLKRIKAKNTDIPAIKSPIVSNLVFAICGFVASPLLFVVLMVPSISNAFKDSMYDSLITFQDNNM